LPGNSHSLFFYHSRSDKQSVLEEYFLLVFWWQLPVLLLLEIFLLVLSGKYLPDRYILMVVFPRGEIFLPDAGTEREAPADPSLTSSQTGRRQTKEFFQPPSCSPSTADDLHVQWF